MTKKKKIVILVVLTSFVILTVFFIFIYKSQIVYEEKSNDKNIEIIIKKSLSFFEIGTMGGYEYTLIVYDENKIIKEVLLKETFWFINDGAVLDESNVSVKWFDDSVKITIDSEESNANEFTCRYQ